MGEHRGCQNIGDTGVGPVALGWCVADLQKYVTTVANLVVLGQTNDMNIIAEMTRKNDPSRPVLQGHSKSSERTPTDTDP